MTHHADITLRRAVIEGRDSLRMALRDQTNTTTAPTLRRAAEAVELLLDAAVSLYDQTEAPPASSTTPHPPIPFTPTHAEEPSR